MLHSREWGGAYTRVGRIPLPGYLFATTLDARRLWVTYFGTPPRSAVVRLWACNLLGALDTHRVSDGGSGSDSSVPVCQFRVDLLPMPGPGSCECIAALRNCSEGAPSEPSNGREAALSIVYGIRLSV